jgi:hypothetical protein
MVRAHIEATLRADDEIGPDQRETFHLSPVIFVLESDPDLLPARATVCRKKGEPSTRANEELSAARFDTRDFLVRRPSGADGNPFGAIIC